MEGLRALPPPTPSMAPTVALLRDPHARRPHRLRRRRRGPRAAHRHHPRLLCRLVLAPHGGPEPGYQLRHAPQRPLRRRPQLPRARPRLPPDRDQALRRSIRGHRQDPRRPGHALRRGHAAPRRPQLLLRPRGHPRRRGPPAPRRRQLVRAPPQAHLRVRPAERHEHSLQPLRVRVHLPRGARRAPVAGVAWRLGGGRQRLRRRPRGGATHLGGRAPHPMAKNEAFNCSNGDVYTWKQLWPILAGRFGLEWVGYDGEEKRFKLTEAMAAKEAVWAEIVKENELVETQLDEVASWWLVDAQFCQFGANRAFLDSMNKSKEHGFLGFRNTVKSFNTWIDKMKVHKIVP
ncbi:hypothetical protein BS78_01G317700 [Paspalum vaginatum]|nr:hypothetical protein BS78_01G317700 [Paspalum vaginatum]